MAFDLRFWAGIYFVEIDRSGLVKLAVASSAKIGCFVMAPEPLEMSGIPGSAELLRHSTRTCLFDTEAGLKR